MTSFEEELRKLMEKSCCNDKVTFLPSMCYVKGRELYSDAHGV